MVVLIPLSLAIDDDEFDRGGAVTAAEAAAATAATAEAEKATAA